MQINLGIVAIQKSNQKPWPGAEYWAGAKVYSSEKRARAALGRRAYLYDFVPAFCEAPEHYLGCGISS